MIMLRSTHRLQLALLRGERDKAAHAAVRYQIELDLTKQARATAEAQATYWRERAEKFLDQIALRQGIISEPTMTAAPEPTTSQAQSVFAALGIGEINSKDSGPGAAHAAPMLTGVDAAAAQAAVDAVLAEIS